MATGNNANEALVEQFCSITGASREVGSQMLEACNGNLDLAIEMQMDGAGVPVPPAIATGSEMEPQTAEAASGDHDVRAPIPQRNEVLVEETPMFGFRGRRRATRSVFDGFRDFQAETRRQEQMMLAGTAGTAVGRPIVSSKQKTLEDLFRPPIDITYKGTFVNAREAGTSHNKWLMVNIQNVQEFACQALNRDVWSNTVAKGLIKEHFIFWQVYHDSEEGRKYMQFYKISTWPYIAILDPRTGENLVVWNNLDSATFCELVGEFLAEHPPLESSGSGSSSPPSAKRAKRDSSIVDASEDDQLEAAIKASLHETEAPAKKAIVIESDSENNSDELETFTDSDDEVKLSPVKKVKNSKKAPCNNVTKAENTNSQTENPCSEQSRNGEQTSSVESEQIPSEVSKDEGGDSDSEICVEESSPGSYTAYLGSNEDPQCTVMFRFPNGQRQQLSIPNSSKLMALVRYAEEQGYSNERYELVTQFPKRQLSYMDFDETLSSIGLPSQETVFVQAR